MHFKKYFKKKEIMRLAILIMSAFMLTACGKENGEEKNGRTSRTEARENRDKKDEKNKKDNKNKKDKDTSNDIDEGMSDPEANYSEIEPIAYMFDYDREYIANEDYSEEYGNASVEGICILSEGYDELKASIAEYNNVRYDAFWTFINDVNQTVEDEEDLEYLYMPWEQDSSVCVTRADNVIFSFNSSVYEYLGGAHGYTGIMGINFDSQTGRELALNDVIKDDAVVYDLVMDYLSENEYDLGLYDFEDEDGNKTWKATVYEDFYTDNMINWWLSGNDLEIIFNAYEIAPYASGPISVVLEDEKYDILKDEYKLKANYYCKPLVYNGYGNNYVCNVDVNGDDIEEQISIEESYNEDDYSTLDIYMNDSKVTLDYVLGYKDAYIMEAPNGKYYLYVQLYSENDYKAIMIYDISNPKRGIKEVGYNEVGAFYNFVPENPENLLVCDRIHIMGTHQGYMRCYVDNDGQIVPYDEFVYLMTQQGNRVFVQQPEDRSYDTVYKANKNFHAIEIESLENVDYGNEVEIKKGEELTLYLTNGYSPYDDMDNCYVILKKNDGSLIKIVYDGRTEDYEFTIDGIPETELFDGIFYAG